MSSALITGATNSATTATQDKDSVSASLGASEMGQLFLKLLVAEVQYQDPLEPTDTSTFVTQLTQLTQTESLQSMQSQLSTQSSIMDSMQTMQLGSQVGSSVMVATSSVLLDTEPVQAAVHLDAGARLRLQLQSADGQMAEVDLGTHDAGDVHFQIDPAALGLPAGRYSLTVKDSNEAAYATEVMGRLNAVRLTGAGTVALQVQGLGDVAASSITRFVGAAS